MKAILSLFYFMCITGARSKVNVAEILPADYDSTKGPFNTDGTPINIGVSFHISGILEVNIQKMTLLTSMYFRVSWREPRLNIPEDLVEGANGMPLHTGLLEKLWLPDLYIHEAVDVKTFNMIQNIRGVFLEANYTVVFSTLIQSRLACPMYFHKYPFDVQTCSVSISSYLWGDDKVLMEWMNLGATADEEVKLQVPNYNFQVRSSFVTKKHWCDGNCTFAPSSIGRARLEFRRRYTGQILTVYIPSCLIVSLAWVSFFWPPDVIPGRTVLVITSLLTIIAMYSAVQQKSPETSYMKAVDVWLFLCILHVVLALFQFAVIITIRRKQKENSVGNVFSKSKNSTIHPTAPTINPDSEREHQNSVPSMTPTPPQSPSANNPSSVYKMGGASNTLRLLFREQMVERLGQIGLPVLFFLCTIVYWPCYVS